MSKWHGFKIQQDYEVEQWILIGITSASRLEIRLGQFPTIEIAEEAIKRIVSPIVREYDNNGNWFRRIPPIDNPPEPGA